MTATLELDGLTAGYGDVPVVRDLTLHVDPGEIVALLGPNGAGKTTTFLTISGLLQPIAGSVRFQGTPTSGSTPQQLARRGLCHVPEDRGLFPGLTVAENLRLAAFPRRRARLDDVEAWFPPLGPLMGRRVALLSGGEQQMLSLARAVVGRPKLLLVDEMSLGLAPVVVEQLFPVIRKMAKEHGCAVVLVEQHADLALEVAERVYVLSHGELLLEGTPAELAAHGPVLQRSYLDGRA